MKTTSWIVASAAAGLLTLGISGANAAPLGANVGDIKAAAQESSVVEQVAQRCWWHRGHRHCRWVPPVYSYYYAPRPAFSFYYGPRYRRYY